MSRAFNMFCFTFILLLIACNQQDSFSHTLQADISQQNEWIVIKGESNLPDQAQITISLLDMSKEVPDVIVKEFGNLKQGHFEAKMKPLKPIKSGSYTILLEFSPASYDWSDGKVIEAVGQKGEKLKGSLVRLEDDGMKVLQHTISFEYKEPKN